VLVKTYRAIEAAMLADDFEGYDCHDDSPILLKKLAVWDAPRSTQPSRDSTSERRCLLMILALPQAGSGPKWEP
jgi:hypothetical protein